MGRLSVVGSKRMSKQTDSEKDDVPEEVTSITNAREQSICTDPPQSQGKSCTASCSSSSPFIIGLHSLSSSNSGEVNLPQFVWDHQSVLSFPEKLMLMLTYVEKEYPESRSTNELGAPRTDQNAAAGENGTNESSPICWIMDGRAFAIRDKDAFVRHLLPLFFRETMFPSFTRRLYRWGFSKVSATQERLTGNRMDWVFGHEHFQRDNKPLVSIMGSVVNRSGTKRGAAEIKRKQKKTRVIAASQEQQRQDDTDTGTNIYAPPPPAAAANIQQREALLHPLTTPAGRSSSNSDQYKPHDKRQRQLEKHGFFSNHDKYSKVIRRSKAIEEVSAGIVSVMARVDELTATGHADIARCLEEKSRSLLAQLDESSDDDDGGKGFEEEEDEDQEPLE